LDQVFGPVELLKNIGLFMLLGMKESIFYKHVIIIEKRPMSISFISCRTKPYFYILGKSLIFLAHLLPSKMWF